MGAGTYLAFLDGDDMWDKRFLTEVVAAKTTQKSAMVFSGYKNFYQDGHLEKLNFSYMTGNLLVPYLKSLVGLHIGSILVDRAFLIEKGIRFTDGCKMGEDVEFISKILCFTEAYAVREDLMLYRQRNDSVMHSPFSWRVILSAIMAFKRIQKFIKENCSSLSDVEDIVDFLNIKISRFRHRLLWKMIRHGFQREALEMLSEPECIQDLKLIPISKLTWKQRLRYRIMLSKNRFIWSCCSMGKN